MASLPAEDLFALIWFLLLWIGYTEYADRWSRRERSLRAAMHAHRGRWMREMLARDNRIVDANIVGNLLQGVAFYASTTLIVLAGLITLLGASDKAVALIREIPFAVRTSLLLWELKLLVLIVIFVHAFFKFTWALRQFNYCSILIGAAPPAPGGAEREDYARRLAEVSTRASKDFNQGMRAYYLSLATLAWFVNPWLFVSAATLVVAVLYWREYRSAALALLSPPPWTGAP